MDDFKRLPALNEDFIFSFKNGDEKAFVQLYDKYSPLLLGIISCTAPDDQAANDILFDSFLRIWEHKSDYDPGKECIFTWMLRFTRMVASEAANKYENKNEDKVVVLIGNQFDLLTANAGQKGNDIQDKIFELMYVHGKSRRDVCRILGTTDQMVTVKLKGAFGGVIVKKLA